MTADDDAAAVVSTAASGAAVRSVEGALDGAKRFISAGIVAVTLVAGVVGYLADRSNGAAAGAVDRAQRYALQAFGAHVEHLQLADRVFDRHRTTTLQRRRAAAAHARAVFGHDDRDGARREYDRWRMVADKSQQRTGEMSDALGLPRPDLPLGSALGNRRHFAAADVEATKLTVLRDAQNFLAAEHGSDASTYALALTMLAVSIFFFGFALTPQGAPHRRLFSSAAVMFFVVGGTYTGVALASPPRIPPDRAAAEYAEGVFLGLVAGPSEYERAKQKLDAAIALWPHNGRAYPERAHIRYHLGVPYGTHFGVLTSPPSGAVEDLERARDLGYWKPSAATELGTYLVLDGMKAGDAELIERGVDQLREAHGMWLRRPASEQICLVCSLTPLLVGETASGDASAVDALVPEIVRHILYIDADAGVVREDPQWRADLLALAMQDLGVVALLLPERADLVADLKNQLVEQVASDGAGFGEHDVGITARASVANERLHLSLSSATLRPRRDSVYVYWYRREANGGWTVVRPMSGPATLTRQSPSRYAVPSASWLERGPGVDQITTCLPSGQYRAEVYVNGSLSTTAHTTARPATFREGVPLLTSPAEGGVGVNLCAPRNWTIARGEPGLYSTFVSPDGSSGVMTARVGRAATRRPATLAAAHIVAAQAVGEFAPTVSLRGGTPVEDPLPFPDHPARSVREFRYALEGEQGTALVYAGINASDEFVVAMAWGRTGWPGDGAVAAAWRSLTEDQRF